MPALLLVRHGQASIEAANYDVLSDLGRRQAALLGQHFAELRRPVHRIVTGPLKRQRDTTSELVAAAGWADLDITEHEGLREFPAFRIVDRVKDRLAKEDEVIRRGVQAAAGGRVGAGYRDAIERIAALWADGQLPETDDLERFEDFQARVVGALTEVGDSLDTGETGLLVTSGGVIAVAVAHTLGLAPARAVELMWEIANASYHEIRLRRHRRILMRFNATSHLERARVLTHV